MAQVVFYEKPGCGGNARQQALLRQAGHQLEVRDLLSWPWTRAALLGFLDPLPVAQWFNRAAPCIKSGELAPESLDREAALALLLAEPLLIRRPLLESAGHRMVGFDGAAIEAWIGLAGDAPQHGLEGCAATARTPGFQGRTHAQVQRCKSSVTKPTNPTAPSSKPGPRCSD